jgi:hypothetical protein
MPEIVMPSGFLRRYWIGIALSVAWLIGATVALNQQRVVEIRREARQCHQIQDDARSSKLCVEAKAVVDQPLCRFKDADCDRWPLEEGRYAENIASFAVLPVVLAWVIFYGAVRIVRWRGKP